MWDLIVSVPDHCLSFYFLFSDCRKRFIQLAFSDHINFSMSVSLSPP